VQVKTEAFETILATMGLFLDEGDIAKVRSKFVDLRAAITSEQLSFKQLFGINSAKGERLKIDKVLSLLQKNLFAQRASCEEELEALKRHVGQQVDALLQRIEGLDFNHSCAALLPSPLRGTSEVIRLWDEWCDAWMKRVCNAAEAKAKSLAHEISNKLRKNQLDGLNCKSLAEAEL